jgi:hypothetical protein
MTERVRRLNAGLAWIGARANACAAAVPATPPADLQEELSAFRKRRPQDLRDTDVLQEGVALIDAVRRVLPAACAAPDVQDRAWATIAASHGVGR